MSKSKETIRAEIIFQILNTCPVFIDVRPGSDIDYLVYELADSLSTIVVALEKMVKDHDIDYLDYDLSQIAVGVDDIKSIPARLIAYKTGQK